jgi:class 3 adenylate cyclase/tetratricopeptide (TPR) repeat protein
MKPCPNCKHKNPIEAKFCSDCGTRLSLTCSHCGTENKPEAKFCQQCGNNLIQGQFEIKDDGRKKSGKGSKEAERRQLTILFCDLVGSTPLSEQLDPEDYRSVITNYHQVAEKVIQKNGGHVAQYLGDGLLVYFGYPEGLEDAPRAGVRTGLDILKAMADSNKKWKAAGKTEVNVRIGIHTGLVVVDDHLALGEAVNIAARLEGLAPENGIVMSPQVHKLVYGWFEVKSMGKHPLKGISEPMEIFRVLHESGAITRLDVAKKRGLSPMVGRKNELNILTDLWERSKKGINNTVLLHGEAGIGKSRLIDTMEALIVNDNNSKLAIARSSAYQQNSAFYPIFEMIEKFFLKSGVRDTSEDKIERLEKLLIELKFDLKIYLPLLAEFLSIPSEKYPLLVMSPFAKRQKIMECISQLILAEAELQPILLVLEDLHWTDASTLEWLKHFITQTNGKNLLTLCTTRPGLKTEWNTGSDIITINLQRLSSADMIQICQYQSKGKSLPDDILDQIAEKTEGVPLFIEEITKTIMESNLLVEKEDGFELTGSVGSLSIPSTLQDSLLARLDRLDEVKEIVQVGSVLGREFSADMLQAVAPHHSENLDESLYKLMDLEILYQGGSDQQKIYQFKHALIQDAAYESLLKSKRQKMHNQVADVLENQFMGIAGTQPELVAHHYTEAGKPLQAIPLWLKAGQMASQKNAALEAIAHLKKGLALLPYIQNELERNNLELDFRLTLGGTYVVSHGFPHPIVKETFDQAREIAQKLEVSPKLALILLNLLSYYFNKEDYTSMEEISDYYRTLTADPENGYWFELFINYFSDGAIVRGEFEKARNGFFRAVELFNPDLPFPWELTPGGYIQVAAKAWLMVNLQVMGNMDQAKSLFEKHLNYSEDHTDSVTLYHIYTFPALYSLFTREWQTSERIMEEYLPIVRKFGDPIFTLTAEVYYYIAKAFQGDQKAFHTAIKLINICFDVGFKAFAVTLAHFIAELYLHIGDHGASLDWVNKILDHQEKSGTNLNKAELLRIKGLTLQALKKQDTMVEEHFRQALEVARKQKAKTFELRAAVALANFWQKQGKTDEAYELLKEIFDWFQEGLESADLLEAKKILKGLKS